MLGSANNLYTQIVQYNGKDTPSATTAMCTTAGVNCKLKFTVENDVQGDLYLFYELTNYHQNNIKYSASVNWQQMMGKSDVPQSDLDQSCNPATTTDDLKSKYPSVNPGQTLNPCGLIASSYFTDIYTFTNDNTVNGQANKAITIDKNDITSTIDKRLSQQPMDTSSSKFDSTNAVACPGPNPPSAGEFSSVLTPAQCTSYNLPSGCKCYNDGTTQTAFYYPQDDTTTYLYEQYPNNISPLQGVTDPNFMNWMNIAALPTFRKLYGTLKGPFKKGDKLNVQVNAGGQPMYVNNFGGTISVVISAKGGLGVSNVGLSLTFIVSGIIMIVSALLFFLKQEIDPRPLGSPKVLNWQQ